MEKLREDALCLKVLSPITLREQICGLCLLTWLSRLVTSVLQGIICLGILCIVTHHYNDHHYNDHHYNAIYTIGP